MQTRTNEKLLRRREVAKMLGVSERTVLRLTESGVLPTPVRIGRSVRWLKTLILERLRKLSLIPAK